MTEEKSAYRVDVNEPKGTSLWAAVKARCLSSGSMEVNPFVRPDPTTGQILVKCPRCGHECPDSEYTVFTVMPAATLWSAPVRKCRQPGCSHIFSLIS